jgi:biotin carboxyl carrier protein
MEYHLQMNNDVQKISVERLESGAIKLMQEESMVTASATRISDNHLYLEIEGEGVEKRGMNVYTADDASGKWIMIEGASYVVEDLDQSTVQRTKKKKEAKLPGVITPPMPAIVVSVPVKTGDLVEKGQKLVVLTAMKMETTLSAPFKGRVMAVNVKEGDKVSPGDILVDLNQGEHAP